MMSDEKIKDLLKYRFNIVPVYLSVQNIQEGVPELISKELALKHVLIPFKQSSFRLLVAMADPFDTTAIEEIQKVTGLTVLPRKAEANEILEMIEYFYKDDSSKRKSIQGLDDYDDEDEEDVGLLRRVKSKKAKKNARKAYADDSDAEEVVYVDEDDFDVDDDFADEDAEDEEIELADEDEELEDAIEDEVEFAYEDDEENEDEVEEELELEWEDDLEEVEEDDEVIEVLGDDEEPEMEDEDEDEEEEVISIRKKRSSLAEPRKASLPAKKAGRKTSPAVIVSDEADDEDDESVASLLSRVSKNKLAGSSSVKKGADQSGASVPDKKKTTPSGQGRSSLVTKRLKELAGRSIHTESLVKDAKKQVSKDARNYSNNIQEQLEEIKLEINRALHEETRKGKKEEDLARIFDRSSAKKELEEIEQVTKIEKLDNLERAERREQQKRQIKQLLEQRAKEEQKEQELESLDNEPGEELVEEEIIEKPAERKVTGRRLGRRLAEKTKEKPVLEEPEEPEEPEEVVVPKEPEETPVLETPRKKSLAQQRKKKKVEKIATESLVEEEVVEEPAEKVIQTEEPLDDAALTATSAQVDSDSEVAGQDEADSLSRFSRRVKTKHRGKQEEEELENEEEYIRNLSAQTGFPAIKLSEVTINPEIPTLIKESLARKYTLIPIRMVNGVLHVAMSDPLNVYAIDDVKIATGYNLVPYIAGKKDIAKAIDYYYGQLSTEEAIEDLMKEMDSEAVDVRDKEVLSTINNAPLVRLVNSLMRQAVTLKASDVHIEPFETYVRVRFRIDGDLQEIMTLDINTHAAVVARIKIMGKMDIAERRIPQDGRVEMKVEDRKIDMRLSTLPTAYGEKVVIRILDKDGGDFNRHKLGFSDAAMERLDKIIRQSYGIILVTGPTGSGKSSTLYTILTELNKSNRNIITVEDPIEYRMPSSARKKKNLKAGLDFASGLRSILRQDPDIIMVGEIRDTETVQIAVRAAITGHLVLSTIHTNDTASTVTRLIDMGVESYLISNSLVGIIAQRLVRKICPACKVVYEPDAFERKTLGLRKEDVVYEGKGCPYCNNTGYKGRTAIAEIMDVNSEIKQMINDKKSAEQIKSAAVKKGMITLQESCKELILAGVTTVEEFFRNAYVME